MPVDDTVGGNIPIHPGNWDALNKFLKVGHDPSGANSVVPGNTRILDLGLRNIADLDNGPVTLYTPAAGDFVSIMFSFNGYVQHNIDGGNGDLVVAQVIELNPNDYFWRLEVASSTDILVHVDGLSTPSSAKVGGAIINSRAPCFLQSADPVVAYNITGNGYPIPAVKPTWQAGHGYVEGDFVTVTGGILVASNAGTSGLSAPTYPGTGLTVLDNGITWLAPTPTTQGAVHLYAMVATPAAL